MTCSQRLELIYVGKALAKQPALAIRPASKGAQPGGAASAEAVTSSPGQEVADAIAALESLVEDTPGDALQFDAESNFRFMGAHPQHAALLTRTGSGNAFIEVMLTVRGCEEEGIKTVLVTYEYGGKDGADAPLLYYEEAANAVISTGNRDTVVELPAANRVGGAYDRLQLINYPGAPYVAAGEPLTREARDVVAGGIDIWGGADYFCRPY